MQKTPKVGAELILEIFWIGKFNAATRYHLLIHDHGYRRTTGYQYRKDRLQYRYMKVKKVVNRYQKRQKPVPNLVLKNFWFGKFGTGTQNNLLISDHEFHTNNIVTIQLFLLIFFRLSFSIFFSTFSFYSCQQFCSQYARSDSKTHVNTD
ncbi:hypothetical protein Hanom_Chr03g00263541 [Helianthus anomalus]